MFGSRTFTDFIDLNMRTTTRTTRTTLSFNIEEAFKNDISLKQIKRNDNQPKVIEGCRGWGLVGGGERPGNILEREKDKRRIVHDCKKKKKIQKF